MTETSTPAVAPPELTILFDGGCPLCRREVAFLAQRDDGEAAGSHRRLAFVDIDDPAFDPGAFGGITYRQAMGRIHAVDREGRVLRDVEVFRRAYDLVGLGWLYAPTTWPVLRPLAEAAYRLWAAGRLRFTGREPLEVLCQRREGTAGPP